MPAELDIAVGGELDPLELMENKIRGIYRRIKALVDEQLIHSGERVIVRGSQQEINVFCADHKAAPFCYEKTSARERLEVWRGNEPTDQRQTSAHARLNIEREARAIAKMIPLPRGVSSFELELNHARIYPDTGMMTLFTPTTEGGERFLFSQEIKNGMNALMRLHRLVSFGVGVPPGAPEVDWNYPGEAWAAKFQFFSRHGESVQHQSVFRARNPRTVVVEQFRRATIVQAALSGEPARGEIVSVKRLEAPTCAKDGDEVAQRFEETLQLVKNFDRDAL